MLVATFVIVKFVLPAEWVVAGKTFTSVGVFWAVLFGLAAGLGIGMGY